MLAPERETSLRLKACADRPAHHPSRVSGSDEPGHLRQFLLLLAEARLRGPFHHSDRVASACSSTDICIPAPCFGVRSDVVAAPRWSHEVVSRVWLCLPAWPLRSGLAGAAAGRGGSDASARHRHRRTLGTGRRRGGGAHDEPPGTAQRTLRFHAGGHGTGALRARDRRRGRLHRAHRGRRGLLFGGRREGHERTRRRSAQRPTRHPRRPHPPPAAEPAGDLGPALRDPQADDRRHPRRGRWRRALARARLRPPLCGRGGPLHHGLRTGRVRRRLRRDLVPHSPGRPGQGSRALLPVRRASTWPRPNDWAS